MKRIAYTVPILALLTCLVSLPSCSRNGKSELQQEAERRAQKWWEAAIAKCGDSYYTRLKWSDLVLGRMVKENELFELKSASYYIKETPVTDADRLNGIEWQGGFVFVASAHRKRYSDNSGWSSWADGVPPSQSDLTALVGPTSLLDKGFSKKNGQWSIGEDGKDIAGTPTHTKPDCAAIPPG